MTMHPAFRQACRNFARAGIGFTVVRELPRGGRPTGAGALPPGHTPPTAQRSHPGQFPLSWPDPDRAPSAA